jgi:hypothetical protein
MIRYESKRYSDIRVYTSVCFNGFISIFPFVAPYAVKFLEKLTPIEGPLPVKRQCSWLGYYATSREFAGSIPDEVKGFLQVT